MDVQFEDLYDIGKEIGMYVPVKPNPFCFLTGWILLPFFFNRGSYSFVHLAKHKQTNRTFAVKIVDKTLLTSRERSRLGSEVDIHKACKHENIVNLEETFETKHRLYLVMEAYVTNTIKIIVTYRILFIV